MRGLEFSVMVLIHCKFYIWTLVVEQSLKILTNQSTFEVYTIITQIVIVTPIPSVECSRYLAKNMSLLSEN